MSKALFIVATQYDNLGDLIINKCLIDELSNHIEIFIDLKNVDESFKQSILESNKVLSLDENYGFSFRSISSLKYFISYRNEFKYLFKSPGPILYKNKRSFKDIIRNKVFELIYSSFCSKGEIFIIGSEVTLESDTLESKLNGLQKFKKILLRSKGNVKYLSSLGFNNVEYIPDLCFLLREKVNPNKKKEVIGISFRELNDPDNDRSIEYSIKKLVNFYTQKGMNIIFFFQVERDRNYTYNLYKQYVKHSNVSFIDHNLEFHEINIYENFRIVISNRLHVLLLGFIHNSIVFPLLNKSLKTLKIPGIFDSIGYIINTNNTLTDSTMVDSELNYDKLVKEIDNINKIQLEICKNKIGSIFIPK